MSSERWHGRLQPPEFPTFDLPDFGIPEWQIGPVHISPRLHLYREDLGAGVDFYQDYVAPDLDTALIHFFNAEPFRTPLSLHAIHEFSALENRTYLTASVLRNTAFEEVPVSDFEDAIFALDITSNYRRHLVVGAPSLPVAKDRWWRIATWMRGRLRTLRAVGKID